MVRFSCFNAHIHSSKPKKTVHLSTEAMLKTLKDRYDNKGLKDFTNFSHPLHLKTQEDDSSVGGDHVTSSFSIEHDWKSDEFEIKYDTECNIGVQRTEHMKSQSVGSRLDREGRVSGGNDSEDETDQGFSCSGSRNRSGSVASIGDKDPEVSLSDHCQEDLPSAALQVSSDVLNNGSIFSILVDPHQSEKGHEISDTHFSGDCVGESSNHTPQIPHAIAKSCSLPNMVTYGRNSSNVNIIPRATSSEDLKILDLTRKGILVRKVGTEGTLDSKGDDGVKSNEKTNIENPADDGYNGYNYVGSSKDWLMPVMDEISTVKNSMAESAVYRWEELPSKDFKVKRIEEWVLDLQHWSPLEETNESLTSNDQVNTGVTFVGGLPTARQDGKVTPGMEAAKRYISSLSATATTAQLTNHGFVVIPFLSAFLSLKALDLSANAIVRITAGALPRGLHILNLSKNNISTIEGLRELTRLRVLDLSYNRILRIGHGLASCSSLKELYLAGNKISEVEGLHRLLKLSILDLRFNKFSTTKCLGQLAANYNSLQAISIEGNPAQKNVGDEQLKKYLLSLLPHLTYLNRQSIKAGTSKDAANRSARLGISAHQTDRGLKSELTTMRKGNHAAAHKMPSSLSHGRRNQAVASPIQSRGRGRGGHRHGHLPPSGVKTTSRPSFNDLGSKLVSFRQDLAMHRSRSEGTLGDL